MKMLVQLAKPKKDLRNISVSDEMTHVMRGDTELKLKALKLENRLLRADNNRMRQTFKTYRVSRSEKDAFELHGPRETIFTQEERSAVTQFINNLSSEGLYFDPNSGEIVRENGRTFAVTGFMSALTKILTDEKSKNIG